MKSFLLGILMASYCGNAAQGGLIAELYPEHDNQAFGIEMAGLGDVNGDGLDDFLIMDERQEGPGYSGRAYVFFGGPGVGTEADLVIQEGDSGWLEEALAGPFDFNGDGFGDIALGAPYYDVDGMENAGMVFAYYGGPDLDNIADHVIPGPWTRYYFGRGLACAGRFDTEDEFDDLAATINTSYGWGPPPTVYVFRGGPEPGVDSCWGRTLGTHYDGFASHLEFAGDTNGDGAGDIVHGLPFAQGLFFDGTNLIPTNGVGAATTLHGGEFMWYAGYFYQPLDVGEAYLGYDIDGNFDFDADGFDDVIAAAPNIEESRLIRGNPDIWEGEGLSLIPGQDVAGLEDINGDGYDDLAIVDLFCAVWVFWGGPSPDLVPDVRFGTPIGEEWDQAQVERAGDVDGDGRCDLLVHYRKFLPNGDHADLVRVWGWTEGTSGVSPETDGMPDLAFMGCFPNPANPRSEISFKINRRDEVQVRIFDTRGRLVRTLLNSPVDSGTHRVSWDGADARGRPAPSGSYLVQILGMGRATTGKISLVR
ncbi:VCBS repeat-containing protein [bacterium]|nr:VCBS repeat-containing protein [bacterium]